MAFFVLNGVEVPIAPGSQEDPEERIGGSIRSFTGQLRTNVRARLRSFSILTAELTGVEMADLLDELRGPGTLDITGDWFTGVFRAEIGAEGPVPGDAGFFTLQFRLIEIGEVVGPQLPEDPEAQIELEQDLAALTTGLAQVQPLTTSAVTGNVLAFGADPTGVADSSAAILNALNANNITRIPRGTWRIDSTITVADGQELHMDRGAVLIPTNDIIVLDVAPIGAWVTGGTIDKSQLASNATASVRVLGNSSPPSGVFRPLRVQNLTITGRTTLVAGSKAIHLLANEGNGFIHAAMFDNITITGHDAAVDIEVNAVSTGIANINGCVFSNFWVNRPQSVLSLFAEVGGVNPTQLFRNVFTNWVVQSLVANTAPHVVAVGDVKQNLFLGWSWFDFSGTTLWQFDIDARQNIIITSPFDTDFFSDPSGSNKYISPAKSQWPFDVVFGANQGAVVQDRTLPDLGRLFLDDGRYALEDTTTSAVRRPALPSDVLAHVIENATRTLTGSDAGIRLRQSSGSTTLTLPSSEELPVGLWFHVSKINGGTLTVRPSVSPDQDNMRIFGGADAGADTTTGIAIPNGGWANIYNFGGPSGYWDAFVSENVVEA